MAARQVVIQFSQKKLEQIRSKFQRLEKRAAAVQQRMAGDVFTAGNRRVRDLKRRFGAARGIQGFFRGEFDRESNPGGVDFGELGQRAKRIRRDNLSGRRDDGIRERHALFAARTGPIGRIIRGVRVAGRVADGDLLAGLSFAGILAGGQTRVLVAAARLAIDAIRPLIEQRDAELKVLFEQQQRRIFDEVQRQLDIERRLREDPDFARDQARRLGEQLRALNLQRARLASPFNRSSNQRLARPAGGLGSL